MKSHIVTIILTIMAVNAVWTWDANRTAAAAQMAMDEKELINIIEAGEPVITYLDPPEL